MVIWITGLAGSGKTSLAWHLVNRLRTMAVPAVLVDGDDIRNVIRDPNTGYERSCRLRNAYRIARSARWLERQHLLVVVSTISLFHEIHCWNREHLLGYPEVLIEADLEEIKKRHPDQLYQGQSVMGQDQMAEYPAHPDLRWHNAQGESFQQFEDTVLALLQRRSPDWLEQSLTPLKPIEKPSRKGGV